MPRAGMQISEVRMNSQRAACRQRVPKASHLTTAQVVLFTREANVERKSLFCILKIEICISSDGIGL